MLSRGYCRLLLALYYRFRDCVPCILLRYRRCEACVEKRRLPKPKTPKAFEEARAARRTRELELEAQEERERQFDREMENIYEHHRAASYRDWEQWALAEEMNRPAKRARGTLALTAKVGNEGEAGVASTLHVPMDSEARGSVTLHFAFQESAPSTPATLPALANDAPPTAVDTLDDPVALEAADRLCTTRGCLGHCVLAVGGILTSDEVVRTYGSSTLSVLQVQRLAYFDGALYYNMASKEEDQTESGGS